jgi:hypothetical protein
MNDRICTVERVRVDLAIGAARHAHDLVAVPFESGHE